MTDLYDDAPVGLFGNDVSRRERLQWLLDKHDLGVTIGNDIEIYDWEAWYIGTFVGELLTDPNEVSNIHGTTSLERLTQSRDQMRNCRVACQLTHPYRRYMKSEWMEPDHPFRLLCYELWDVVIPRVEARLAVTHRPVCAADS